MVDRWKPGGKSNLCIRRKIFQGATVNNSLCALLLLHNEIFLEGQQVRLRSATVPPPIANEVLVSLTE